MNRLIFDIWLNFFLFNSTMKPLLFFSFKYLLSPLLVMLYIYFICCCCFFWYFVPFCTRQKADFYFHLNHSNLREKEIWMVLIKILDPVHKIGIFVVGYHLAIGIFFQTIKIDEKKNVSIEFVFYTIIAINTIRSNELDFYLEIQFQWAQWSHLKMGQNATTIAHQTTFYEQFKNKNWALLLGSCMLWRLIWGVLTTDSSNNNKNTSTNNKSFGLIGFLVLMLNNYKDKLKLQWSYLSMSGKHKSKQQPNYKIVQKNKK